MSEESESVLGQLKASIDEYMAIGVTLVVVAVVMMIMDERIIGGIGVVALVAFGIIQLGITPILKIGAALVGLFVLGHLFLIGLGAVGKWALLKLGIDLDDSEVVENVK